MPIAMKQDLAGHDVLTAREMGWEGKRNGELLSLADGEFDVLVTKDRNVRYQQNLALLHRLAVIVLLVPNNRQETIRSLSSELLSKLTTAPPRDVTELMHPLYRRKR